MQVVLNVTGSFRTTGSGHNREVVALCRWPLEQVPLSLVPRPLPPGEGPGDEAKVPL